MARTGFSLLELSVVLVIIGLLAGGVMTGQALIRAAELRGMITEVNKYTTAVNTFHDKYGALPGDMPNATAYWGAAHANAATCKTTTGTGTLTCNGDGNSHIGYDWTDTNTNYEDTRAWQHLSNAGMIEGKFTGTWMWGSNFATELNINAPGSKIANAGWMLMWWDRASVSTFPAQVGNQLQIGGYHGGWMPDGPMLTAAEAWSTDTKLDDGKPGTGSVLTWTSASATANCTAGTYDNPTAATYSVDVSGLQCILIFRLGV